MFFFQSVCCIDKKGLLSWSNPSAEKIFVHVSSPKESHKLDHEENKFLMASGDTPELNVLETNIKHHEGKRKKPRKFPSEFLFFIFLSLINVMFDAPCHVVISAHISNPILNILCE